MKYLFISDIHGSSVWLEKAMEKFKEESADQIIILGDLLYHGPRNPIPEGYDPKKVIEILNENRQIITCVRGNCDAEVDQMVLNFPIMSDYIMIMEGRLKVFATHGHLFNKDNMPNIGENDVLIHGHTHLPVAEKTPQGYVLNPGSITLPKGGYENSYGILENEIFEIKTFNGEILKKLAL